MADEPVQRRGGEERGARGPGAHGGPSAEHLCCRLPPGAGEHMQRSYFHLYSPGIYTITAHKISIFVYLLSYLFRQECRSQIHLPC